MALCDLTSEEIGVLREVLGNYDPDLRMEIGDTDNRRLRGELKHKEKVITGIMAKLEVMEEIAETV